MAATTHVCMHVCVCACMCDKDIVDKVVEAYKENLAGSLVEVITKWIRSRGCVLKGVDSPQLCALWVTHPRSNHRQT